MTRHQTSTKPRPTAVTPATPTRLLDRDGAAGYMQVSVSTIDRLINTGQLSVVRLPVERTVSGTGRVGTCRRILIDVRDLDSLIDRSKESLAVASAEVTPLRRAR